MMIPKSDDEGEFGAWRFQKPKISSKSSTYLGIFHAKGASEPKFNLYESRLESFESWPKKDIQSPEKLAEAGFFFTKNDDETVCFFCNVGIKEWDVHHDPWFEHARWSRNCFFVGTRKKELYNDPQYMEHIEVKSLSLQDGMPVLKKSRLSHVTPENNNGSYLESQVLSNLKLCALCNLNERTIVFLPCGHFSSCNECVLKAKNCFICEKKFKALVRASLQ